MHSYTGERPNSQHGFFRQCVWVAFNACAVVALAACGGGGGGGGDAPPATNPPANNAAPVANAGADQTVQLPSTATLTGSATDDGLPAGSSLTYAWSTTGAGVTFGTANAATTTATFATEGSYTLVLTVSDGALSDTDEVAVTVQAASGGNQPPTVDAGADQTITLPTNQATLTGTATDPEGAALTYAWTADPAGVTFADAAAASTTATFAAEGTYTLTLTANDGATTGTDTLTVVVNPAPSGTVFWPGPDDDETDPDRGWLRATPEEAEMTLAKMQEAEAYAVSGGVSGQTIDGAGMIVRGGRLVHSWAVGMTQGPNPVPSSIDARFAAQSATKSIGGIALGLAIDTRGVTLADRAVDRHASIGNPPGTDDPARLGLITIQQLATHTSGFPKDSGYNPLAFDPGTTWTYSDGGLNWLADVLTNVFQEDLRALLTREVWAKIGINNGNVNNTDDIDWRANSPRNDPPPGSPPVEHRELASGMSINVNAMSRVGLLFLRNGNWESGRILSEAFVTTARTPVAANAGLTIQDPASFPSATTNYGVLWWTNAGGLLPHVPRDAYWAWGQGDSLIVVIPSLDLVVARIGRVLPAAAGRAWGETNWTGQYEVLAPFLNPIVCAADANSAACNP
jgi:CubicO group peptidase (beta-lactamase class C family)